VDEGIARPNSGTGRLAGIERGIGIGEAHSLFRQLVQIRRLVEHAASTGKARPAELVCENEADIEFCQPGRDCAGLVQTQMNNTVRNNAKLAGLLAGPRAG